MMTTASSRESAIELVPAMMVALLQHQGDLPDLPAQYAVDPSVFGFRKPTLAEGAALTWLCCWPGPATEGFASRKPSGIAGYQDRYDFNSASDVRDLCYLAGSRRAVVELVRTIQRQARVEGRRLIGSTDCRNRELAALLVAMGATATRIIFEDRN
jgi:hypothetical protein